MDGGASTGVRLESGRVEGVTSTVVSADPSMTLANGTREWRFAVSDPYTVTRNALSIEYKNPGTGTWSTANVFVARDD